MATATKDMWVANLVQPWRGDSNSMRTAGGGLKSGPKANDDRYAPRRPHDIHCYNCGLVGHTPSSCPRGQRGNLNGIGRTKATPPSYPK